MEQIQNELSKQLDNVFKTSFNFLKGFEAGEKQNLKESFKVYTFEQNTENPNLLENIKGEDMPGIRKRNDGRYEIRKMENGQRISMYARSEKEALSIFKKLKNNKIKIEQKQKEKQTNLTLKEWIIDWENTYKKPFVKQKTLKDIHNSLKEVFIQLGHMHLTTLNTSTIQKFLNSLKANRTKERIQTYLNAILQKAYNLDLIKKNPFNAVEKAKKGKYKNFAFTIEEQEVLIKAIKNSNIEHEIYCYLLTGARPNELPNKENFDFIKNVITINGTKNENAKNREIQMSQEFSNYMKDFFKTKDFTNHNTIQKTFKKICEEHGIQNAKLYRLRHTFASNHFILGTQTKQVSEWMGHSSTSITLDIYTDIDKNATKEKIQNLYNNFYYIKI